MCLEHDLFLLPAHADSSTFENKGVRSPGKQSLWTWFSWDWSYQIRLSVTLITRLDLAKFSLRVAFHCLHRWGMLTATRRYPLLRDIKGLNGESLQEEYLGSWMGHFGTETIHSLSIESGALNLTNTMFLVETKSDSSNSSWVHWLQNRFSLVY